MGNGRRCGCAGISARRAARWNRRWQRPQPAVQPIRRRAMTTWGLRLGLSREHRLVQLCYRLHGLHSINFVPWKIQKEVAADLKCVCSTATVDEAEHILVQFEFKRGKGCQLDRPVLANMGGGGGGGGGASESRNRNTL